MKSINLVPPVLLAKRSTIIGILNIKCIKHIQHRHDQTHPQLRHNFHWTTRLLTYLALHWEFLSSEDWRHFLRSDSTRKRGMIVGSKSNQAFCQVLKSLSSASAWPKKLKFLNCTQIESQITITELKRGWMCFSSVLFSRRVSGSDNDNSPAKKDQLSSVAGKKNKQKQRCKKSSLVCLFF